MGEVISYTKEGIEALIADAIAAAGPSGNSMGVVVHGADANVARPAGYEVVYWIGSVEPVNAEINDFRVDPDADPVTLTFATQADIDAAIAGLIDSAPETLNTMNEIAAAFNDDPAFLATLNSAITDLDTRVDTLEAAPGGDFREIVVGGAPTGDLTLVDSTLATGGALTSQSVAKPDGVVAGDTIVLYVGLTGAGAEQNPTCAGFTEIGRYYNPGAYKVTLVALAKVAGGSEPASYTVNWETLSFPRIAATAWRNAGPISSLVASGGATQTNDMSVGAGGVATAFFFKSDNVTLNPTTGYTVLEYTGVMSSATALLQSKDFSSPGNTGALAPGAGSGGIDGALGLVITPPDYTDYTLELTDDGKVVEMPGTSSTTLTVPTDASVAFPIGTSIKVRRLGTGVVTISPDSGVTLSGVTSLSEVGDEVILQKRSANNWHSSMLSGKTLTTQAELDAVVDALAIIGTNNQTDSYTLVLADAGKVVELNKATAVNLTVPPNADVPFPIGTVIELWQQGAGQVTVVEGAGVTVRSSESKKKLYGQYASASLRKRGTDEWVLVGDLVT